MPEIQPGWYADPEHAGYARWWNGVGWADARMPIPSGMAAAPPSAVAASGTAPGARGNGWVIAVAISVSVALVAGTTIAATVQVLGGVAHAVAQRQPVPQPPVADPYTKGTSTSPPVPPPTLTTLALPQLTGAVHKVSAGGLNTQEDDEFAIETGKSTHQNIATRCSALTFDTPVAGGTRDVVDPVEALPQYVSNDGTTSMAGALQAFPTAQDALNYLDLMSQLLKSCVPGFRDSGGTDVPVRTAISLPGASTLSWSQKLQASTGSATVNDVEIRDGRFVALSYCSQSTVNAASTALCSAWASAVAVAAATAN